MNLRSRPSAIWVLPCVMLAATLLILGSDVGGAATRLRATQFDFYQQSRPRPYQDTLSHSGFAVRVLNSDAASLKRFGPWPWPHGVLAKLARDLKAKGAAMIVFAFPLDVRDPLSPLNLAAELPQGPQADAMRAALSALPSPDNSLTMAMSKLATTTGFTLGTGAGARSPVPKSEVTFIGNRSPFAHVPDFSNGTGAIAPVEYTSLGSGALNLTFEPDGKLRRMPLVFRLKNRPVPSLTAEILRLIEHKPSFVVRSDEGTGVFPGATPTITSFEALNLDLPTAPDGSMWIAFSGKRAERDIGAAALDDNKVAATRLANAIVILGPPGETVPTATGARSIADVYAESLENILTGTPLRRPPWAITAEILCLAIFGMGSIVLFVRFGVMWSGVFAITSVAAASEVSWHLYVANHVLIDVLCSGIALMVVFLAQLLVRGLEIRRARSRIRSVFAESLPPNAVEQIVRNPELFSLTGVNRTVTYMVCGVRSFAAIAASLKDDPSEVTRLVQRVLVPLMDVVRAHGGTIDRLGVDSFSAFWNAPLDDSEHALHACEAANVVGETVSRLKDAMSRERYKDGAVLPPVEIGVGISTGPVTAGGISAYGRTAYSVSGDCVTVANRLQKLSAQYGQAIIIGEDTRKATESNFAFLEVDYIATGARGEPLKLHALLGSDITRASPRFRALLTFHDHILQSLRTRQWGKARALIEQCRKLSGASQRLYDLYLERISHFEANPPGSEWDGSFRLS